MKFTTLFMLGCFLVSSTMLLAQQTISEIQTEADQIKKEEGSISFSYAEKLLELAQMYQIQKDFQKATDLDQEVTLILNTFSDSIPPDYETEYIIQEQLENLRLKQYLTQWESFIRQEQYSTAQQLIQEKDWIERSIKAKAYLGIMHFFQIAHRFIGSQHEDYLNNWEKAYFLYNSVNYYNLQQARNLWKAITQHRAQESQEESFTHLEVLFGYASFCDRTNDTETYNTLKTTIEKHWPYAFGNNADYVPPQEDLDVKDDITLPEEEGKEENSPIFVSVEEMPRFPGCEALQEDHKEKKACADLKLLQFIYKKITYPTPALENGIQGMSVVSFTVTEYGTIVDFKILRDPGGACGQEALRVIKFMNELPSRWTPGKQRGKHVRVKYNLPVRFKLT